MWLFFALLGPLLWAIVHLLDAHCVDRVFNRPWVGVITGSVSSLPAILIVPFAAPFMSWEPVGWQVVVLALLAGALIQLSQGLYFQALEYTEAGIVAAYWNMTPVLLPIASYLLFGQSLGLWQSLGMLGLVACSACFCLLDQSFEARWRSFVYMFIACCAQAGVLLVEKYILEHTPFLPVFLLVTTGIVISGSSLLLLSPVRQVVRNNMASLKAIMVIITGMEIINLAAILCSQQAINLGIPTLVAAVETTVPAYTFLLSVLLFFVMPRFADLRVRRKLNLKLLLVSLMVIGVGFVSDDFV
jgi:drug/metabolite transporter (DMT)-like permease